METIREITLTPADNLVALYREKIGDYPKFFKMDLLARLGFVGVELLLETLPSLNREMTAIILANRNSSIHADRKYQETISDPENYYPSPALFVYTLPNIVAGEIAIRHGIYGETAFYVLDREDDLEPIVASTLATTDCETCIVGWIEAESNENYYAHIKLIKTGN